ATRLEQDVRESTEQLVALTALPLGGEDEAVRRHSDVSRKRILLGSGSHDHEIHGPYSREMLLGGTRPSIALPRRVSGSNVKSHIASRPGRQTHPIRVPPQTLRHDAGQDAIWKEPRHGARK